MSSSLRKPQIVQAADAIAYLPLYVAEDLKPKLKLESGGILDWKDGFGPTLRQPPERLVANVQRVQRDGDHGCLHAIVNARAEELPLIGICDPCEIPALGLDSKLTIVAGLITKACFWCLTDKELAGARQPDDLAPDLMCIHDYGFATGHAIGRYVEDCIKDRRQGPRVVTGEFDLLVDGAVWLKKEYPNARVAAISASILSCVIAEKVHGFEIPFAMHNFGKFGDCLATAIVVHKDFLHRRDVRDSIKLLIRGVMEARRLLRLSEDDGIDRISRLCQGPQRFPAERLVDCATVDGARIRRAESTAQVASVTHEIAAQVYDRLVQADIYSPRCDISSSQWENAWSELKRGHAPPLDQFFDRSLLEEAWRARLNNVDDHVEPIDASLAVTPASTPMNYRTSTDSSRTAVSDDTSQDAGPWGREASVGNTAHHLQQSGPAVGAPHGRVKVASACVVIGALLIVQSTLRLNTLVNAVVDILGGAAAALLIIPEFAAWATTFLPRREAKLSRFRRPLEIILFTTTAVLSGLCIIAIWVGATEHGDAVPKNWPHGVLTEVYKAAREVGHLLEHVWHELLYLVTVAVLGPIRKVLGRFGGGDTDDGD